MSELPDRSLLFGVAYRMLGDAHEAQDAVQEGLLRWHQLGEQGRAAIREPAAWLTRVVSRICLDQLSSARARHEAYVGPWLPEPLPGVVGPTFVAMGPPDDDPADRVTLDESVTMALLVVLEQLTPGERVSLLLHDVFGMSFAEVAEVVGRTPQACRQLASTARRQLRQRQRFTPSGPERDAVITAFVTACQTGDLARLTGLLDPSVVVRSDGGGVAHAARRPVVGAAKAAAFLLGIVGRLSGTVEVEVLPVIVNGVTGLLVRVDGQPQSIIDFGIVDGAIVDLGIVVNPAKLHAWS